MTEKSPLPDFTNLTPAQLRDFHKRDDTDTDIQSHHHTLGMGRYQATPGNHIHDGKMCRKIGEGMGLTITGAKGGNTALTSLIAALQQVMDITDLSGA